MLVPFSTNVSNYQTLSNLSFYLKGEQEEEMNRLNSTYLSQPSQQVQKIQNEIEAIDREIAQLQSTQTDIRANKQMENSPTALISWQSSQGDLLTISKGSVARNHQLIADGLY